MTSTPVSPAPSRTFVTAGRSAPWSRRIPAAVVAALTVALSAHFVAVLAFFIGSGSQNQALTAASNFYSLSTVFLFLLVGILVLFGGLKFWFTALLGGLAAAIIAALIGSAIPAFTGGAPVSGEMYGFLIGTILGINLIFVVTATVVTSTLARRVHGAMLQQTTSGGTGRKTVLIRMPASNLDEAEITHIGRLPVDAELADSQWDDYVTTLQAEGWEAVEVAAAETMADSVFVEDTVIVFGETAVLASPGVESRQGEIDAVETTVRELGLTVQRIDAPGTLDGGDVLKVGSTVYVGRGGRTNAEGIRQLRALVTPLGFSVVAFPMTKALHLKSAVTALPDGTVIGYAPLLEGTDVFDRFLAMPEPTGSHVIVLDDDAVLMAASAPLSAALIADLGYRVVTVDISEFEKLEGSVTCLSVRIR